MKSDVSLVDPLEYNLATRNAAGDMLLRVASVSPHRVAVIEKTHRGHTPNSMSTRMRSPTNSPKSTTIEPSRSPSSWATRTTSSWRTLGSSKPG